MATNVSLKEPPDPLVTTDLKVLLNELKIRYKDTYPNDERWPCPFCLVLSKTKIQCNTHITKDHSHMLKTGSTIKQTRPRFDRKCKKTSSQKSEAESTPDDLIEFLKIVENDYSEFNEMAENVSKDKTKQKEMLGYDTERYEFTKRNENEHQTETLTGPCPYCPAKKSKKKYKLPHGLRIHCAKIHADKSSPDIVNNDESEITIESVIDKIVYMKKNVKILKRIPKGARVVAAHNLSKIIDKCVQNNDVKSWCDLLFFSYAAFQIPVKKLKSSSLVRIVKKNINDLQLPNVEVSNNTKQADLTQRIESKISEGDVRGAVKLLISTEALVQQNDSTLQQLQAKHPSPSRQLNFPEPPDTSIITTANVNTMEVYDSIQSFANGSASGIDGIRPQHLKDLVAASNGDAATKLLQSITNLENLMLSGKIISSICPIIYGATLCALSKKSGGLRPIAVGSTYRRLAAKLACKFVRNESGEYLRPTQIGVNTSGGCEAAVHATRTYLLLNKNSSKILLKIDFENAFNSVERDVMLNEIKKHTPSIYPFMWQCYSKPSFLFFGNDTIMSQVGAQQGDPCGPLAFSLSIQPIIEGMASELNLWYLDDGTLCGEPEVVLSDLRKLINECKRIGLNVNPSKCELFFCSKQEDSIIANFNEVTPGIRIVTDDLDLLGAPLTETATKRILTKKKIELSTLIERLSNLKHHIAFYILKHCLTIPKLTYLLRTSCCFNFEEHLFDMDNMIKLALEKTINSSLDNEQWTIASLPIQNGGLGIRKIKDIALPAFLASVNSVAELVNMMFPQISDESVIASYKDSLSMWSAIYDSKMPENKAKQKAWDIISVEKIVNSLQLSTEEQKARYNASIAKESSAWLTVLPSRKIGSLLDDDTFRISIALRLGCDICMPHQCKCGVRVEKNGIHGLSCKKSAGRHACHSEINNILCKGLRSANIPSRLEPQVFRDNGKRADGITLVPWCYGKMLVWDATIRDTLAPSYIHSSSLQTGSVARRGATEKRNDYKKIIEDNYIFLPFACETLGPWCPEALDFVIKLGNLIKMATGEPRSKQYLRQRISLAIQRTNAARIMGTFENDERLEEIFYILSNNI